MGAAPQKQPLQGALGAAVVQGGLRLRILCAGYSRLLCRVLAEGELQRNRKGVNRTLSKAAFTLDIDLEPSSPLAPPEDPAFETLGLVPLTTLRFSRPNRASSRRCGTCAARRPLTSSGGTSAGFGTRRPP